jgi:hypothetical protein
MQQGKQQPQHQLADGPAFWNITHDFKPGELESDLSKMFFNQALDLHKENEALKQRIKRMDDCIETAWGIIANVSGGDWTRQKPHWQEAVVRWRDNDFHPIMKELSERKAKEDK